MLVRNRNVCTTETMWPCLSHGYLIATVLEAISEAFEVEIPGTITVKLRKLGDCDDPNPQPETQIICGPDRLNRSGDPAHAVGQRNTVELMDERSLSQPAFVSNIPVSSSQQSNLGYLNATGVRFLERFERLGELADLENAISNQQKAVELTDDGHPSRPGFLSNLGISHKARFGCFGELADLENTISNQLKAVELTGDRHPDKPMYLSNLGNSQESRFGRLGELADLENSIYYRQKAVELTDNGHPDKPMYLTNLGSGQESRFGRFGELADLENAISNKRKASRVDG
jgi:hypothetical protein